MAPHRSGVKNLFPAAARMAATADVAARCGLSAMQNINTLIDYRFTRKFVAPSGEHGMGSDCYGRAGKDIIPRMPVGTIITDEKSGEVIADLSENGKEALVAAGGKGGLGNLHFKSPTNRAPRQSALR